MTKIAASRGIASLTGIRGVAASWVFLQHIQGFATLALAAPWLMHLRALDAAPRGIELFFILSGFILMHVHAREFVLVDRIMLRRFYVRRFFRVYPLNTVILLAIIPIVLLFPSFVEASKQYPGAHYAYKIHTFAWPGLVQSLLLVQSWTVVKLGEWNGPAWTLSAEVLGYIFFPFVARFMMTQHSLRRCLLLGTGSLLMLCLAMLATHHVFENTNPSGTMGAVRMLFCSFAGVCLYRCFAMMERPPVHPDLLCGIGIAVPVATMFVPVASMLDVFGFAALILGLAYQRGTINRAFASRPALFMGKISFSFALVHGVLIAFTEWCLRKPFLEHSRLFGAGWLLAIVLSCVLLGILLHAAVEIPGLRVGRRVNDALDRAAGVAPRTRPLTTNR